MKFNGKYGADVTSMVSLQRYRIDDERWSVPLIMAPYEYELPKKNGSPICHWGRKEFGVNLHRDFLYRNNVEFNVLTENE